MTTVRALLPLYVPWHVNKTFAHKRICCVCSLCQVTVKKQRLKLQTAAELQKDKPRFTGERKRVKQKDTGLTVLEVSVCISVERVTSSSWHADVSGGHLRTHTLSYHSRTFVQLDAGSNWNHNKLCLILGLLTVWSSRCSELSCWECQVYNMDVVLLTSVRFLNTVRLIYQEQK